MFWKFVCSSCTGCRQAVSFMQPGRRSWTWCVDAVRRSPGCDGVAGSTIVRRYSGHVLPAGTDEMMIDDLQIFFWLRLLYRSMSHQKHISVHDVSVARRDSLDSSFTHQFTRRTDHVKFTVKTFVDIDQLTKLFLPTSTSKPKRCYYLWARWHYGDVLLFGTKWINEIAKTHAWNSCRYLLIWRSSSALAFFRLMCEAIRRTIENPYTSTTATT